MNLTLHSAKETTAAVLLLVAEITDTFLSRLKQNHKRH